MANTCIAFVALLFGHGLCRLVLILPLVVSIRRVKILFIAQFAAVGPNSGELK